MKIEKWSLHIIVHFVVIVLIYQNALVFFGTSNAVKLAFYIFVGGLIPDIDHFSLIRKPNFKDFKEFLKWALKSDRHRIGFELFHNFPAVIIIIIIAIFIVTFDVFIALFVLSFLLHLLVDIIFDRLFIKTTRHWRFTSRI